MVVLTRWSDPKITIIIIVPCLFSLSLFLSQNRRYNRRLTQYRKSILRGQEVDITFARTPCPP